MTISKSKRKSDPGAKRHRLIHQRLDTGLTSLGQSKRGSADWSSRNSVFASIQMIGATPAELGNQLQNGNTYKITVGNRRNDPIRLEDRFLWIRPGQPTIVFSIEREIDADGTGDDVTFICHSSVISNVAGTGGSTVGSGGPTTGGPGTSAVKYLRHDQTVASQTWTVNHNFGEHADVSVFTPGGVQVMTEVVQISVNQVQILFDSPELGYAILQ